MIRIKEITVFQVRIPLLIIRGDGINICRKVNFCSSEIFTLCFNGSIKAGVSPGNKTALRIRCSGPADRIRFPTIYSDRKTLMAHQPKMSLCQSVQVFSRSRNARAVYET